MSTLELISVLVAIAAIFGWISSRWLKLPITIGTMLLTVLVSGCLAGSGHIAPGLHAWALGMMQQIDFQSLILRGMLPLLLFAGAFLLDVQELWRQKLAVGLLSVPGTVLAVFLVAAAMFVLRGAGAPSAAVWMQCLIFGALISPTDPIAVLEMLRRTGVPKPIQAQLAGESLFNDGVGAVLFLTLLEFAVNPAATPWHIAGFLLLKAGGGILLGVAAAWVASWLMRMVDAYQVEILLTLTLALGGYALADALRLSAPLEAVVAGIALRSFNQRQPRESIAHGRVDGFWSVVDEVQNSLLFVLLGLEVLGVLLDWQTVRAGISAIVCVNAVRLAVVVLFLALTRFCQPSHRSSTAVLTWGGLRGGLSIALALSVPESLGRSWMLGATYLVVVFSIVLQGGSMDLLLRWRSRKAAAVR